MNKKILLLALLPIFLSACSRDESRAKDLVLKSLKDPDSAKFGKFIKVGEEGNFACLTVNAKNGFGAYTGDQQAILENADDWRLVEITDIDQDGCIRLLENRILLEKERAEAEKERNREPTKQAPKVIPLDEVTAELY